MLEAKTKVKIFWEKSEKENQENIDLIIKNYDSRIEALLPINNMVMRKVVWYCQKYRYNRKKRKAKRSTKHMFAYRVSHIERPIIESPDWYSNFRFRTSRATAPDPSGRQTLCTFSQYLRGSRSGRHWLRTLLNTSLADTIRFPGYFRPIFSRFSRKVSALYSAITKVRGLSRLAVVLRSDVKDGTLA